MYFIYEIMTIAKNYMGHTNDNRISRTPALAGIANVKNIA